MPVHFSIQEETGPELPNVTDDSDPVGALQRALMTWPSVSTITVTIGTTPVASAGLDGVNLLSFADTPANRSIFEKAGGATALTMFFYEGSNLTEADVLFNPDTEFTTTIESQEELNATGLYDVEGQALHELGHAIGLDHTGVEASSMWAIASLAQRQLVADDLAGVRSLYPLGNDYGSIEGTVLVGDAPAFGAQVVAVDSAGRLVSGLTLGDGTYVIENLEPGSYTVYVEPLDGPHGSMPSGDCIVFTNMSESGIYGKATLTTDFTTVFLGGNADPMVVSVLAGESLVADFTLSVGASPLNPTLVGSVSREGGSVEFTLGVFPMGLEPATEPWVGVAGTAVDSVDGEGIAVLGNGVTVDPASRELFNVTCNGNPLPVVVFHAAVAADAIAGSRTLLLSSDEGIAALTGAFRVLAGEVPTPCVGDCDGSLSVSVDELVFGVNIALGEADLAACPEFDADSNDLVTVDELVQAVNSALEGCPETVG